jgi:hypothetical protein
VIGVTPIARGSTCDSSCSPLEHQVGRGEAEIELASLPLPPITLLSG